MFYRFTDRSRKGMSFVNKEAAKGKAGPVNAEHILLGLLKEGTGVGVYALRKLGVDLKRLEKLVRDELKAKGQAEGGGDNTKAKASKKSRLDRAVRFFTGIVRAWNCEAKEVIDEAIMISKGLGDNYVGTEHLLVAILKADGSAACIILLKMGLTAGKTEEAVLKILAGRYNKRSSK